LSEILFQLEAAKAYQASFTNALKLAPQMGSFLIRLGQEVVFTIGTSGMQSLNFSAQLF
jgi:hypothetical protein